MQSSRDALNHASIIAGVRLGKATLIGYKNEDKEDVECSNQDVNGCLFTIIVSAADLSMDGIVAPQHNMGEEAEKFKMGSINMKTGVRSRRRRRSRMAEKSIKICNIQSLPNARHKSGGAMGGFTTGKKEIIDMVRQRLRRCNL